MIKTTLHVSKFDWFIDSEILHGHWFLSKQYDLLILKNHCAINSTASIAYECGEMHCLFVFKSASFSFFSHMSSFCFATPSIKNKSPTNSLQLTKNASFLYKLCHASCFGGWHTTEKSVTFNFYGYWFNKIIFYSFTFVTTI